jgi:hypothetical protein
MRSRQRVHALRERALQRAAGRARGGLGAGVDEVGHGLGLREVELVVEEGALRELARLGQAAARAGLQAARQQQLQQHRAAVGLQLEHVLAGVGVRRREVQRQALVDGAPSASRKGSSVAWRGASVRPQTAAISGPESAPEARTMPTAPRPGAVAMATMGSA